jgi:hypothetical protein
MSGALSIQKVLSGELAARDFLLRPPEPPSELLVSPPSESIFIGKTSLLHTPFFWNPKNLVNPHICVVGITGSGKSYFVKSFITRAGLVFGASALILDWAGEYSGWVKAAGGRTVSFGKDGINLLDLGGTTPHIRARQVMDSLEMLTDIAQFPQQRRLTEAAIEQVYSKKGFRQHEQNEKKKPPTLEHAAAFLQRSARRNPEAAEAARRIKNLILSTGKSFTSSTINLSSLLSGIVCVDLHSLPTEPLRSMAGLAILQFAKEKMRAEGVKSSGNPRLFIVVDEAWKIASDERSDVVAIVREGRKYGFGLIVASQNPTDIHKTIFSNAGSVFCFRLTHAQERQYVRSSLTYSEYYESASHNLSIGQALVHLEYAKPHPGPKNFVLSKVDGEELLVTLCIRGVGMDLEFERGALSRKLLSFGLSDKQLSGVLSEFERHNYSLEAAQLVSMLEKGAHSRASILAFLRSLGADEKSLVQLFSSMGKKEAEGNAEGILALSENSGLPAIKGKRKKRR